MAHRPCPLRLSPTGPPTAGSVMSVGFRPAATGEMGWRMEIGGAGDGIDPVGREWLSGDGIRQLSTKATCPGSCLSRFLLSSIGRRLRDRAVGCVDVCLDRRAY